MGKLSVVINTYNEEKNIETAIESVTWADEIIVCDMHSEDNTVEIAKKLGAKVFFHKKTGYVEPARNFAISKVTNDWVLILDADEQIPQTLALKIKEMVNKPLVADFVEMPRKNIIFGKWMKASMWWPDYNIRLFKKGAVTWSDKIHSKPTTTGLGLTIPAEEEWSITHFNYQTLDQFITRMLSYSKIQAQELAESGYKFDWKDLISKPVSEFLSRFFAGKGYQDGVHGLALSFLQAVSFLLVYLRLWEMERFRPQEYSLVELEGETKKVGKELGYWFLQTKLSKDPFKRFFQKLKISA